MFNKLIILSNAQLMKQVKFILILLIYIYCFFKYLVALSVGSVYFGICYFSTKSEKYKQEVNRLVECTIDLLKQQAHYRPNEGYLPIIHIRDQLILPSERQGMYKTYFLNLNRCLDVYLCWLFDSFRKI